MGLQCAVCLGCVNENTYIRRNLVSVLLWKPYCTSALANRYLLRF